MKHFAMSINLCFHGCICLVHHSLSIESYLEAYIKGILLHHVPCNLLFGLIL